MRREWLEVGLRSLSFLLALFIYSSAHAEAESLYFKFKDYSVVSACVLDPKDQSHSEKVKTSGLKQAIEKALLDRKSIRFQIASTPKNADILIETTVTEYYWTDHDPVDMLMGVGATAMDAAIVENYVRLQADIIVKDAKKNTVLWRERVMATITGGKLTEENAPHLINERMAKVFIKACFAKTRKT